MGQLRVVSREETKKRESHTFAQMGEQIRKEVIREDSNIALDVAVKDKTSRDGRLVLSSAPPLARGIG